MVSRADFNPAVVFKMVAIMCERGSSTATNAMKTEIHLEPAVDSEENTVQELLAAVARVKTMPARPAIE
jgi:cell division protein FtsX